MAKRRSGKPKGKPKGTGGKASLFKIVHVLKDCIGCGACASISTNWKAKGEKFVPKKTDLGKLGKEMLAAESCPVNCIHIVDTARKKRLI